MQLTRIAGALAAGAALVAAASVTAPQTAHAAPRATSTPDPFSVTVTATSSADAVLTTRDLLTGATRTYPNAGTVDGTRISPDGLSVVYVSYPVDGSADTDLDLIDLASGTVSVLVSRQAGVSFTNPTFTPDGTSVAYTRYTSTGSEIDAVATSGGTPSTLQTNAQDPAFRADGTLVFVPTDSTGTDPCLLATSTACVVTQSATDSALGLAGGTAVSLVPTGSAGGIAVIAAVSDSDQRFTELGAVDAYGDAIGFFARTRASFTDISKLADPVLSQTGTELYFLSDVGGSPSVQALDTITGTQVATLSKTEYVSNLDVFGVATSPSPASLYQPVSPTRILNTRTTVGGHPGPIAAGAPFDLVVAGRNGVPADASAVVLNLTGVSPSAGTYLQLFPTPSTGSATPTISNVNLAAGQTAANSVTVTLGAGGAVRIANGVGSANVIVDLVGYYEPSSSSTTASSTFTPLGAPSRVLDTRYGVGVRKGAVPAGGFVDLPLPSSVPDGVTAVVLDLGGTGDTSGTFLSAYPTSSATPPATSTLNLAAGDTRANLATVPVGSDRVVRVYNAAGSEQVFADLDGYYSAQPSGDAYFPVDPTRIFDTRSGAKTVDGVAGPITQGGTSDGPALGTITTAFGQVDIPISAVALQVNLTSTGATAATFLSLSAAPDDGGTSGRPTFSSLNVPGAAPIANAAITARSDGGEFRIYNAQGSTQAVVDIAGYFAAASGD